MFTQELLLSKAAHLQSLMVEYSIEMASLIADTSAYDYDELQKQFYDTIRERVLEVIG